MILYFFGGFYFIFAYLDSGKGRSIKNTFVDNGK